MPIISNFQDLSSPSKVEAVGINLIKKRLSQTQRWLNGFIAMREYQELL